MCLPLTTNGLLSCASGSTKPEFRPLHADTPPPDPDAAPWPPTKGRESQKTRKLHSGRPSQFYDARRARSFVNRYSEFPGRTRVDKTRTACHEMKRTLRPTIATQVTCDAASQAAVAGATDGLHTERLRVIRRWKEDAHARREQVPSLQSSQFHIVGPSKVIENRLRGLSGSSDVSKTHETLSSL